MEIKNSKTAIITGINGQDGAYLAQLLIKKGYTVIGCHRNINNSNFWRLKLLGIEKKIIYEYLDLKHYDVIENIIYRYKPDEFYNLGGLSSVSQSFKDPKSTVDINGVAVTKILEAIRIISPKTKFYQASSSEMFGKVNELPITEDSLFHPRSPYAAAKIFAHHLTINYREAYNIFACSGILFNHESPLRGPQFVTSKIIQGVKAIKNGSNAPLVMGNINAQRDWGYAKEYVEGMWLMLQQEIAQDYVLATGIAYSVRDFITMAFQHIGKNIIWTGTGLNEVGIDKKTNQVLVSISDQYYRPADIDIIYGDASKALKKLGWKTQTNIKDLLNLMINAPNYNL